MSLDLIIKGKEPLLVKRAHMLRRARDFFDQRGVLEIDAPILSKATNIDDYIDPIQVQFLDHRIGYLHTSPELFLKKLLSQSSHDWYFLGHVFRDHENGDLHDIEFTMLEWYRQNKSFDQLIDETVEFIQQFIPKTSCSIFSYLNLFEQVTGLNANQATKEQLTDYALNTLKSELNFESDSRSDLVQYIFTEAVEPTFETKGLVVVQDYPYEQAALAKVAEQDHEKIAKRFEVYYNGIELANGYDELQGEKELRDRYEQLNNKRAKRGKNTLPLDENFLRANAFLPNCCGVALGFDRLMMIYTKQNSIHLSKAN